MKRLRIKYKKTYKYTLLDDKDFTLLCSRHWRIQKSLNTFYVARHVNVSGVWKTSLLHREIFGKICSNMQIDHINGNGLDNRRKNLRVCSSSQNQGNRRKSSKKTSSNYKGVYFHKKNARFVATIFCNRKHYFLGSFKQEKNAAKAYDIAATKLFGDFAKLNRRV